MCCFQAPPVVPRPRETRRPREYTARAISRVNTKSPSTIPASTPGLTEEHSHLGKVPLWAFTGLNPPSQEDRKEQKAPGELRGPHGGQMCTGHHSSGAGGTWCGVQPSEGGSGRWVVAAGGGDSSREEGRIDMAAERMHPRGAVPWSYWAKQEGQELCMAVLHLHLHLVRGGTVGATN